jgi:hypothetical protein
VLIVQQSMRPTSRAMQRGNQARRRVRHPRKSMCSCQSAALWVPTFSQAGQRTGAMCGRASSKRDDEKSRCSNQKTKRPEDRGDEIVACPDAHGVSGLTTQLTDCRCERALAANPTSKNPKACKLQRGAAVRCSVWFGKNLMHLERIGTIIRKAKSSVQRHRSPRRKATLSPGRSHLAVRRQKSSEKRTCCQEPHPQPQTR